MRVVIFTILLTILFVPALAFAQAGEGIVPCTGTKDDPCTACQLVTMVSNLMEFFVYAAVVVATLMFTWAGIKYVTSGTKPDQISEAHKIFFNVMIGLVLVLGSWLIVDLILRVVPGDDVKRDGIAPWSKVLCEKPIDV